MHILIIEDDRELCDALRSQLISRNHTADCCHTGSEALYHALSGAYDLILLDRMLPEIDGLSILRSIRQNHINAPVILTTGSTGDGYRLARSAGHSISQLYATESALISDEPFILDKSLQGISLREIKLSVLNSKGKAIISHQHDLLFTHFVFLSNLCLIFLLKL